MAKRRKKNRWYLATAIGASLAIGAGVFGLTVFVNFAGYKHDIEVAASDALGMDVCVNGRLGVGFFPDFHLSLRGLVLRNRDTDLAVVDKADVGLQLRALFTRQLRIGRIVLKRPHIRIERAADGTFNFSPVSATVGNPKDDRGFKIAGLAVSGLSLAYLDKKSGDRMKLENCDVAADDIQLDPEQSASVLGQLSLRATLACESLRLGKMTASDVTLRMTAQNGVLDFKPIELRIFGGKGTGNVRATFAGKTRRVDMHYDIAALQLNELLKAIWPGRTGSGDMNFALRLSAQGDSAGSLKRSMHGMATLRGENLAVDGTDLDGQIERLESSQSFDLLDAGALFVVGPLGLVATKGQDFVSVFQNGGGRTRITRMVSEWEIKNGVARAKDVAMATDRNRIALKGRLNFVHDRFDAMTVGVVDARGCLIARQTLRGSFSKPIVENPNVLKALTAPVAKLFSDLTQGGSRCNVFYAGAIAAPR